MSGLPLGDSRCAQARESTHPCLEGRTSTLKQITVTVFWRGHCPSEQYVINREILSPVAVTHGWLGRQPFFVASCYKACFPACLSILIF